MTEWEKLSPYVVSKYISFNRDNKNWVYTDKKDMANLQAEGVAGICQRLARHNIAFLADEVGMGKTIQAFGVMSMLWKEDKLKKRRVLVFAPRREVALQWEREYKDFFEKHIKSSFVIPKVNADNVVVLNRLNEKNNEDWLGSVTEKQLVIVKTTSLSYLVKENENHKEEARKLISEMKKFDLVVIDEAQYFRNKSNSLRSQAAEILFKDIECPVLLMSATPNHSSVSDLNNIVSYFNDVLKDDEALWNKLVIRRFRVLSSKGYVKYNYRREIELPAYFKKNIVDKDEIFFALYQKRLLEESLRHNMGEGREFWRYLEGTEFDPKQFEPLILKQDNNEETKGNDHETAEDRIILKDLISEFEKVYKNTPENPKYKKTREELLSNNYKEQTKALVFSRRIPSVKELARGIVAKYDQKMWEMIRKALGGRGDIPQRKQFDQRCRRVIKSSKKFDDEIVDEETTNENIYSEVLSWFRPLVGKHTEASRFVRRFDISAKHEGGYRYLFKMDHDKSFWKFDIEIKSLIQKLDFSEAEMLGLENLIRKASRYASIGIVELFCCHIYSVKNKNNFFKVVEKRWSNMKLRLEIIDMVENFRLFYSKVVGLNKDDLITGNKGKPYEWKEFDNALPTYAYTASSRNESVLKRFNSPFFPDILISTSVLQEGVNLQFFCDKIVHYGIAWTAGDDEQRIGRIDRILSLTERNLDYKTEESYLDICYPYLVKTHDEKRLGDFLLKKRGAEIFLDKGEIGYPSVSKESTNDIPISSLLGSPQVGMKRNDPYPWKYTCDDNDNMNFK